MLSPADHAFLSEIGTETTVTEEGGWTLLIIANWPLPSGYSAPTADLLIRISPGYPDLPLDMWYFAPALTLQNGGEIPQTQVHEIFAGREWQRWSRHLNPGDWQPGRDDLRSYMTRLRSDLRQWVGCAV